jgi:LPXTG-site transpeptidase (sortase) family protein
VLAGLPACGGALQMTSAPPGAGAHTEPQSTVTPVPPTPSQPAARAAHEPRVITPEFADPATVKIPAVDIDAKIEPLHRDDNGRLVAPDYGIAGWYAAGPEPGEPGVAVIAGHLDSTVGPDMFYNLGQVEKGDRIVVGLTDGSAVRFRVGHVEQYPVDDFPTSTVYGDDVRRPELRLITCAGDYDYSAGHYKDNLVVFAWPMR